MTFELRPVTPADAEAHHAGEDDLIVRWLSGGKAPVEGIRAYFADLAENAARGEGKRGFIVWEDGEPVGYMDFDPTMRDGLEPGQVNIAYAVYTQARGRGVAARAVGLMTEHLRENGIGRAAIRVEPENHNSVRTAEKAGFLFVHEFVSGTDTDEHGNPATMRLYLAPESDARQA